MSSLFNGRQAALIEGRLKKWWVGAQAAIVTHRTTFGLANNNNVVGGSRGGGV